MELLNKSFSEWWKSLKSNEKDEAAIILSEECNAALSTVQAWGLGYRTPKQRSQELIVKYFRANDIETDSLSLFP